MTRPSGRFILRIPPELHSLLRSSARRAGLSLNQFCAAVLDRAAGGAPAEFLLDASPLGVDVRRLASEWKDRVEGIVLFGSQARGQAWDTSDIDLLFVLKQGVPLSRDLYRRWDELGGGAAVSPAFVSLPEDAGDAGGLWYEAAVDGIVAWDPDLRVSRFLGALRREIAEGRARREYVHGQPYWRRKGAAA